MDVHSRTRREYSEYSYRTVLFGGWKVLSFCQVGAVAAPMLALHSTDGGKTWTNEYNGVLGQMIMSMNFVSSTHGYATTVNALQISSLLEFS